VSDEVIKFETEGKTVDPTDSQPRLDTPLDLRPDLSELGIIEHERGVCEDTYDNRSTLRRAKLNWDAVYDATGGATGLIAARSQESMRERRVLSLAEKRPILTDAKNPNSDYLTGVDLLVDEAACQIIPPWVLGATRKWVAEQNEPTASQKQPAVLPARCRIVKDDGIRCMLWSSGRIKDDGLCRAHLKSVRKPGEDVERARRKLIQAAPYAVDVLEDMMENAESEPVKLKAATEILDRAGVRGGTELSVDVEVNDARPPHVIVAERLARLAAGAASLQSRLTATDDITDAEIVEDSTNGETVTDDPQRSPEVITSADDSGSEGGETDDV
jgi:hypothetical protein